MKAIDRLYIYLEHKGIKPTTFEREIGFSSGYLSRQKSRGSDLGESMLKQINDYCQDLSLIWLLTGEGDMLKTDTPSNKLELLKNDKPNDKPNDKGSNNIYTLKPKSTAEHTDFFNDKTELIQIPIVDISAAAGYGIMNPDYIEKTGYISLPANMVKKNALYYWIRVRSHSMNPTLHDSDLVLVRHLDPSEWLTMPDEHIYMVVDKDGIAYIKRVKNRFKKGFVVLMSDNIDKMNYPNFNLNADEIHNIFHAEWYFSARMDNINNLYYNRLKALEDRFDEIEQTMKRNFNSI